MDEAQGQQRKVELLDHVLFGTGQRGSNGFLQRAQGNLQLNVKIEVHAMAPMK
jgi:hypothetical protein